MERATASMHGKQLCDRNTVMVQTSAYFSFSFFLPLLLCPISSVSKPFLAPEPLLHDGRISHQYLSSGAIISRPSHCAMQFTTTGLVSRCVAVLVLVMVAWLAWKRRVQQEV